MRISDWSSTCALPISDKYTSSYATSADVGDATVAVAGTVAGNAESSTPRGKATTTVTGTIGGDAVAPAAYGNDSQSSRTTDSAGTENGRAQRRGRGCQSVWISGGGGARKTTTEKQISATTMTK